MYKSEPSPDIAGTLILDFLASRMISNECWLFKLPSVQDFLQQPTVSSAAFFSVILQSVLSTKQGRTWQDKDDGDGHLVTVVFLHSGSRIPSSKVLQRRWQQMPSSWGASSSCAAQSFREPCRKGGTCCGPGELAQMNSCSALASSSAN